ncbi:hypothetical protein SAMN02787142_7825 [Burkholderia sp. WP9]|nr:hypothetical protein SAMN02787142_7825 [Burkholderia sp. WP9]
MCGGGGSVKPQQCTANSVQLVSNTDGRYRVNRVEACGHGTGTIANGLLYGKLRPVKLVVRR